MDPDIERQWIAEELKDEEWNPGCPLALLVLLLVFLTWRCCG
jgi:hypothetical protein